MKLGTVPMKLGTVPMKLGTAPMKLGSMPWPGGPLISDFKLTYKLPQDECTGSRPPKEDVTLTEAK
jgi:hypothetical protein